MTEIKKYFTTKEFGGYSNCKDRGNGDVIPNCVGLAWGLFFLGHAKPNGFDKRPRGDANEIYAKCVPNGSGFKCSKNVYENSMLCYNVGEKGHVVYCWFKSNDGYYNIIESNYSGNRTNGKDLRILRTKTPKSLYKNYIGCVYDTTF